MKTQSRIRLVVGVVSPLVLFISLVFLPLAREGSTTAAMFPESEATFEFTNDETEDAYDLHIKWGRAVKVTEVDPFKDKEGSGTAKTDLSNGVVLKTEKASVTVTWDGTKPKVEEWWWTKKGGGRLGTVKKGNPTTKTVPVTANLTSGNGLQIATFDTLQGRVIVRLPDDMRAGDTISGTVISEPKGSTEEERNRNSGVLNGCVVQIQGQNFPVNKGNVGPMVIPPDRRPTGPGIPPQLDSFFDVFVSVDLGNSPLGRVRIPLLPSDAVITPDPKITPNFIIPPLGQTGRPIVITGPFDGNSSNTTLRTSVQDFEKNTENVSGGFGLLAESPRKAVFSSPVNVTGPIQVTVKDGGMQTTGNYRNVGVDLTAPKTSLLKGESTELRVQVNGLEGIKEPVPLTLECKGVVTMTGGNYQPLTIQPSEVGADGRFTTTRTVTGVQTGVWEATATVVTHRFDVCLQDDTAPHRRLLWNTFNGEYVFINPLPPPKPPQTGSTTPTSLTGTGKIARKGCILVLTHNAPDRRVMSRLDGCNKTGDASVQTTAPKADFTITDRNIADNTCPDK